MESKTRSVPAPPRMRARVGEVAGRLFAAVAGGYVLAVAFAIALAKVLPMARADAVLAGLLSSFAIHVAAVVWAFAARTVWRAWMVLLVLAAGTGAVACLAPGAGAA